MTKRMRRRGYILRAHALFEGYAGIPCGTFGPGHHPVEKAIADLCEYAYQEGLKAKRKRTRNAM